MDKGGFRCFLHSFLLIPFHSPSMKKSIIIYFDLKCYRVYFSLVHSTYKAVSPSILLQPVTYKPAQTQEWAILSAAYTGKPLFVSCVCKNFPKGVSFITHLKSHTSQRFLQLKLWSNTSNQVPTETKPTEIVRFFTRFYPGAHFPDHQVQFPALLYYRY